MSNNKAIPKGYMTVGEVAKKMGVTVRTLQYYDREGLLSPTAESEGGRRLYTDQDIIKLHQILSMKYLGFSLDAIKNRLIPLDTPAAVADVLREQAAAIREKIENLTESLEAIEVLKEEVLQMQSVNFKKYADIIVNLQMRNEYYWMIKHIDDRILDHFRSRFDMDSGLVILETLGHLQGEAIQLYKDGVPPESEKGQQFAKAFWDMIMEFTGGDMNMLPNLMELGDLEGLDGDGKQKQKLANAYIGPALDVYFTKLGFDPLKGEPK